MNGWDSRIQEVKDSSERLENIKALKV